MGCEERVKLLCQLHWQRTRRNLRNVHTNIDFCKLRSSEYCSFANINGCCVFGGSTEEIINQTIQTSMKDKKEKKDKSQKETSEALVVAGSSNFDLIEPEKSAPRIDTSK